MTARGTCGGPTVRPVRALVMLVCTALLWGLTTPVEPQAFRLTGGARLARIYDAVLDARFDAADALLTTQCSGSVSRDVPGDSAPPEACDLLRAVALWWRIELDPESRAVDARFEQAITHAITRLDAWTARQPDEAQAWFYLGGAYGARAQWRVLRGERLAGARDGARIKRALERALAIDPQFDDAYFGIGLYRYLADVVSGPERFIRWLLLLPGGDKDRGLREMLRARAAGQLLADEADYQLHRIYLWYENQPERALSLLMELRQRHPRNPLFRQLVAEVQDTYVQDPTASLREWEALIDDARHGRVEQAALAEATARLGAAKQRDAIFETDTALVHLRAVVETGATAPHGALARAHLQIGRAFDRLGQRAEAVAAYRAALASAPVPDPMRIAEQARDGLRRTPSTTDGRAYRLSLEGLRALEQRNLTVAARAIAESLRLRPDDLVTKYRHGLLLLAQQRDADALTRFEEVGGTNPSPPTIQAEALVHAAMIKEAMGERTRAIELYEFARGVFGADQRTIETASRALARLGVRATPR